MDLDFCIPEWIKNSNTFSVIITDLRGHYIYVNEHFRKRFDFICTDFIGKHSFITVHPEDHNKCTQAVVRCLSNPHEIIQVELRKPLKNAEDQYEWTDWEFSQFYNDKGELLGVFCLGYDVSKHKQTLGIVLEKNMRLREIARQQAHEVRGPLSSIMGLVFLITLESDFESIQSYLPFLHKAANELDKIIHKIVSLTENT